MKKIEIPFEYDADDYLCQDIAEILESTVNNLKRQCHLSIEIIAYILRNTADSLTESIKIDANFIDQACTTVEEIDSDEDDDDDDDDGSDEESLKNILIESGILNKLNEMSTAQERYQFLDKPQKAAELVIKQFNLSIDAIKLIQINCRKIFNKNAEFRLFNGWVRIGYFHDTDNQYNDQYLFLNNIHLAEESDLIAVIIKYNWEMGIKYCEKFIRLTQNYIDEPILQKSLNNLKEGIARDNHMWRAMEEEEDMFRARDIAQATGFSSGAVSGYLQRLSTENLIITHHEKSPKFYEINHNAYEGY